MMVRELIEHLKAFPEDAKVITRFCSDYEELVPDNTT